MKSLALTALFIASLYGQTQPLPKVTPGTPAPAPQTPPPAASAPATIGPDTVVVEVAGKKYTKQEVDKLITALPLPYQQAARSNPQMLSQIFTMRHLADDAEKAGLDKQSPLKESLEFNRLNILAQAQLTNYQNMIPVDKATLEKYYQEHPERFNQAKVRVIQIMFSPTPDKNAADGKKMLSEAEAKAKIEELRKQVLAGGDFAKLAEANSDDKASGAKGGDFGIIKHNSAYPDQIKNAVFALKPGGLSDPVKPSPTSFYLIRVDEMTVQPYDEVSTEITQIVRTDRFNQYMKSVQDQYKVKVENPAYFSPAPPAQLQQVRQ